MAAAGLLGKWLDDAEHEAISPPCRKTSTSDKLSAHCHTKGVDATITTEKAADALLDNSRNDNRAFTLTDLSGTFLVWAVGSSISVVVFLVEIILNIGVSVPKV